MTIWAPGRVGYEMLASSWPCWQDWFLGSMFVINYEVLPVTFSPEDNSY